MCQFDGRLWADSEATQLLVTAPTIAAGETGSQWGYYLLLA